MAPLTPEQYLKNSYRVGGYLKDIPEPHIRRWPGCPRPRKVHFAGGRFAGFVHYHMRCEVEHNGIWQGGLWVEAWDDAAGRVKTIRAELDNAIAAVNWCWGVITAHYSGPEWQIIWPDFLPEPKNAPFRYTREGD